MTRANFARHPIIKATHRPALLSMIGVWVAAKRRKRRASKFLEFSMQHLIGCSVRRMIRPIVSRIPSGQDMQHAEPVRRVARGHPLAIDLYSNDGLEVEIGK